MLRQRIATALVLTPLTLALVLLAGTGWLSLVLGGIACLGAWEWSRLAGLETPAGRMAYVMVIGVVLYGCYLGREDALSGVLITVAIIWWVFALFLLILIQRQILTLSGGRWFTWPAGIAVLVPAWYSLMLLYAGGGSGRMQMVLLLVMIWSADIAAYFCGKKWGKTPLCPRISPGKTWQGAGGGLLAGVIAAIGFALAMNMQLIEIMALIVISLTTVLASIVGDLLESLMKRGVHLKDSGQLLPGHGGVLDRIDSLTAAAPVYVAGAWLAGILP